MSRLGIYTAVALSLVASSGCGQDQSACLATVASICQLRATCAASMNLSMQQTMAECQQQVALLMPCAQSSCPSGTSYDSGEFNQCQTDLQTVICQDLLAGKVATSCTQTCH